MKVVKAIRVMVMVAANPELTTSKLHFTQTKKSNISGGFNALRSVEATAGGIIFSASV